MEYKDNATVSVTRFIKERAKHLLTFVHNTLSRRQHTHSSTHRSMIIAKLIVAARMNPPTRRNAALGRKRKSIDVGNCSSQQHNRTIAIIDPNTKT